MRIKPEWIELQTQFAARPLNERVGEIINDLKALQHKVEAENGIPVEIPASTLLLARRIQQYVEWSVPDLLPDEAEAAELLVNAARIAARLAQKQDWEASRIIPVITAVEALNLA